MAVNFLDIIHSMNNEHPIKEVFQNLLEEQPKELIGEEMTKLKFKVDVSDVFSSNFKKISFKGVYERIDSTTEGPIGYIAHIKLTNKI
jgi:hypothetical protein